MQTTDDHSKGFALGYIVVLKPTMVNSFHWGYTRQSFGIVGNTDQQWNMFLGLTQPRVMQFALRYEFWADGQRLWRIPPLILSEAAQL